MTFYCSVILFLCSLSYLVVR